MSDGIIVEEILLAYEAFVPAGSTLGYGLALDEDDHEVYFAGDHRLISGIADGLGEDSDREVWVLVEPWQRISFELYTDKKKEVVGG